MKIVLTERVDLERRLWWHTDRKTAIKIGELLQEIAVTPYVGRGKPEALKYELTGYWSRRINERDRLVYTVDEEAGIVYIASMKGH